MLDLGESCNYKMKQSLPFEGTFSTCGKRNHWDGENQSVEKQRLKRKLAKQDTKIR